MAAAGWRAPTTLARRCERLTLTKEAKRDILVVDMVHLRPDRGLAGVARVHTKSHGSRASYDVFRENRARLAPCEPPTK